MNTFNPVEKSFWLHKLCEANFSRLVGLVPDLPTVGHVAVARVAGKPSLHLRLIERSPYTLIVDLTHDFAEDYALLAEPGVRIRVCLDARTAEMLCDHERPAVLHAVRDDPAARAVLDYKWTLNYFLARWLDHCLAHHYRFQAESPAPELLAPTRCAASPVLQDGEG
jgi:uncharacterized protein YqiB (DUF1249 family)